MSIVQSIKNAVASNSNSFKWKFNNGSIGGVICDFELDFTQTIPVKTQTEGVIGQEGSYADYKFCDGATYDVNILLGVSSDKNRSITSLEVFNAAHKEILDVLKPSIRGGVMQGQFFFSHPVFGTDIVACVVGDITTTTQGYGGTISFKLQEILNDVSQENINDLQKITKSSAKQKKKNIFSKIKGALETGLNYANATTNELNNATNFFNNYANTLVNFGTQLSSLQNNILGTTQNYANFLNAIQTFKGNISQFTATPSLLADNVNNLLERSANVFTNNPNFVRTALNDKNFTPFVNNAPIANQSPEEVNRYHLNDISYKAIFFSNFCTELYDYQFSTLQEIRSLFNKFYTMYLDLLAYRIYVYTNEYNDRIYLENAEPSNEIVEITDLMLDLAVNTLSEFREKRFNLLQYKTFYAHRPYTLIGLHYILYKRKFVESEGQDLINLNELKDLSNITGEIKYIIYG